jgi:uncharacterized protein DUF6766
MRRFLKEQSLALVFFALFLASLIGDGLTGWQAYNNDQTAHHEATISLGRYLTSSDYGRNVLENWQSEYLQFTLFILLTVWLLQRGSNESKKPGEEGRGSDREQQVGSYARADSPKWAKVGGLRRAIYENSLLIVMATIWILAWFGQSVTGWSTYNADQITHHEPTVNWLGYIGTAEFWEATLQNWQSEFLAVGTMVVFAIYLRQRGSPESKPVGAAHNETAVEG